MKKIKLLLISISFVINLTACRSYSDKLNNLSEMEIISKIDNLENSENTNKKYTEYRRFIIYNSTQPPS